MWTLSTGSSFGFTVARLDEIHPFISGNKYFKLKYNLQSALAQNKKGIITMGGAFQTIFLQQLLPATKPGWNRQVLFVEKLFSL
ncbi:MAG: hypothetical protein IPK31_00495 [Chitinophagaceae bacterium]|nr:hypothetical protein [Chitinophagaceae bacterium]